MTDRQPSPGYASDEIKSIMVEAIISSDNPEDIKEILRGWARPEVDNMLAALEDAGYAIGEALEMTFKIGDRVRDCGAGADPKGPEGTIVRIESAPEGYSYYVEWDGTDYAKYWTSAYPAEQLKAV